MADLSYQLFEIELTDRCNASCKFCPREMRPKPHGFMQERTFQRILDRILAHQSQATISFCGRGEPTLHPNVLDFIKQASEAGVRVVMTSNASLIDGKFAQELFDSGLDVLLISAAALPENYQSVYKLPFERLSKNIDEIQRVVNINGKELRLAYVVGNDAVPKGVEKEFKDYWKSRGIQNFVRFDQINRAGSLGSSEQYKYRQTSLNDKSSNWLMLSSKKSCFSPFVYHYTLWNGNYSLCSHEWQERVLLGNVFDHDFRDYQKKVFDYFSKKEKVCNDCDIYYENNLDNISNGAMKEDLRKYKLKSLRKKQKVYRNILLKKKYVHSIELIKELF